MTKWMRVCTVVPMAMVHMDDHDPFLAMNLLLYLCEVYVVRLFVYTIFWLKTWFSSRKHFSSGFERKHFFFIFFCGCSLPLLDVLASFYFGCFNLNLEWTFCFDWTAERPFFSTHFSWMKTNSLFGSKLTSQMEPNVATMVTKSLPIYLFRCNRRLYCCRSSQNILTLFLHYPMNERCSLFFFDSNFHFYSSKPFIPCLLDVMRPVMHSVGVGVSIG